MVFRYQAPALKRSNDSRKKSFERKQNNPPPRRKVDSETFQSFGLRSARTKGPRKNRRGGYNPSHSQQESQEPNNQKPNTSEANQRRFTKTKGEHSKDHLEAGPSTRE